MGDILYIDIILLENFFMNYFLLYLLKRLARSKAPSWRLVLGAFIGSAYVLIVLMPNMEIYLNFTMKILVSLLMIVISFLPYTFREFGKLTLLFYLEAFFIGGSIMAIYYLSNKDLTNINGVILLNRISQVYIIIGSLIGIVFVKLAFDYIDGYFFKGKLIAELEIFLDNKHCTVKALIDTGNNLKDPLNNFPVVVVYIDALKGLFSNEFYNRIKRAKNYDEITNIIVESDYKLRVRMIPFKALGIDNGLIAGLRVDKIIVTKDKKFNIVDDAVVAIYNLPLSDEGDFEALAFPEIIK